MSVLRSLGEIDADTELAAKFSTEILEAGPELEHAELLRRFAELQRVLQSVVATVRTAARRANTVATRLEDEANANAKKAIN